MQVVVLGGGVIGVSTAYYLAQLGAEVTVVERQSSTSFSRVQVKPSARPLALGYVLVLDPQPVVQQEAAAAADAASQAASAGSAP